MPTNECQLKVILSKLQPCEMLGKVLVVVREDHRRRTGKSGYMTNDIKLLLRKKLGINYKEVDLEKVKDTLIALNLFMRVSSPDMPTPHHDLSASGTEWADAILEAARDRDERFIPYVRTRNQHHGRQTRRESDART